MGGLFALVLAFTPTTYATGPDGPTRAPTIAASPTRLAVAVRLGTPYGLRVLAIQPGSIYDRAGFHPGDTLLAIDGVKALAMGALDPLAAARRPAKALVQRGGALITLTTR